MPFPSNDNTWVPPTEYVPVVSTPDDPRETAPPEKVEVAPVVVMVLAVAPPVNVCNLLKEFAVVVPKARVRGWVGVPFPVMG